MQASHRLITQVRSDPVRQRRQLLSKLSEREQDELGVNLGAGADHPRAWVGPPFYYDLIGGMQFQLLMDLGMREYHRFLDVGCGSLRLGRLAMMYLLPGRYFGVEPNRAILERGCQMHFGEGLKKSALLKARKPRFTYNSDFDFSFTDGPVDFVFAQSIASHTGPAMTRELLQSIASVSHDDTIAMVTFIRCIARSKSNLEEGWFYPRCVTYTDDVFGSFAQEAGFHAYTTVWPSTNIREDGLITTQHPTILTRKPWKPHLGQKMTAALFDGIVKIN